MGLRGRSPTGVTNEGGYPKYLTAPWSLSYYSSGQEAQRSGLHIRAMGSSSDAERQIVRLRESVRQSRSSVTTDISIKHKFTINLKSYKNIIPM